MRFVTLTFHQVYGLRLFLRAVSVSTTLEAITNGRFYEQVDTKILGTVLGIQDQYRFLDVPLSIVQHQMEQAKAIASTLHFEDEQHQVLAGMLTATDFKALRLGPTDKEAVEKAVAEHLEALQLAFSATSQEFVATQAVPKFKM